MYLFFFHINRHEQTIRDPEGTHLAGVEDARREAILSARAVAIQDLQNGNALALDHSIAVADEHGLVLLTVTFKEALGSAVANSRGHDVGLTLEAAAAPADSRCSGNCTIQTA